MGRKWSCYSRTQSNPLGNTTRQVLALSGHCRLMAARSRKGGNMNELLTTKLNKIIKFYEQCGADSDKFCDMFDEFIEMFDEFIEIIKKSKRGNLTNKESLDLLVSFSNRYVSQEDNDDLVPVARECRMKLQELVDRATPKKVVDKLNHYTFYKLGVGETIGRCGRCGSVIKNNESYCNNCGQAIDWSE